MDWRLELIVGHEGMRITTVPQIMANASPFFRRMLQPDGFAEGRDISKTGSITVQLPEDNAPAMAILCDIFHLRSMTVPGENVTPDNLANIATLVDKYDCAATIQPWPRIWIAQVLKTEEQMDSECMSLADVAKWIHISCQLGFDEQLGPMTAALICGAEQRDLEQSSLLFYYHKLSQKAQGTRFRILSQFTTDNSRQP